MKIAGIDVSRGTATVCVLETLPKDLKRFKDKWKPFKFNADAEGIHDLLALDFDAAILEPTGGHYSKIWAHHIQESGREVRWVGHREVANYRHSWRVFNKTDNADAIALACYGLERWNFPQFFLKPKQQQLRDLYLQLQHLNRSKNPTQNRLRLQLSHELPEVAQKHVSRDWLKPNPPGLWLAISGESISPKWQKVFDHSIGLGISDFSQSLAKRLCELERQEYEIELALEQLLQSEDFTHYRTVFDRFMIGGRTAAALLSVIYPIEQFLENGKPIIERVGDKRTKRNRSLAAFKLSLGLGMTWYQSGETSGWKPGGRKDIRTALWRWCKTMVIMTPKTELEAIAQLRAYYEKGSIIWKTRPLDSQPFDREVWSEEVDGVIKAQIYFEPGIRNQRVMRVVRRMVEMLFRDLVRAVSQKS